METLVARRESMYQRMLYQPAWGGGVSVAGVGWGDGGEDYPCHGNHHGWVDVEEVFS
jgi:hypothetical protein